MTDGRLRGKSGPAVVARSLTVAGFMYLVLRPVSSNVVLVPLLALLGLTAAVTWLRNRQRLYGAWHALWYLQILFGALGTAVAAFQGNPGLVDGMLVYLAAPVLFWLFTASVSARTLKAVLTGLAVATAVLSTGILLYVLGQKGIAPQLLPAALLEQSGAAFTDLGGSTELRLYGLSSLAAAGPIWCASLLVPPDALMPSYGWRLCAATTAVGASFVSGRRAILVLTLLTPVLLWSCRVLILPRSARHHTPRLSPSNLAATVLVIALSAGVASVVPGLIPRQALSEAVGSTQALLSRSSESPLSVGPDVRVRQEQATRLIAAWSDAPLLGHGFGAVLSDYRRSDSRPWNFELQYCLLLFQTGFLGVLFTGAFAVLVIRGLRAAAARAPTVTSTLLVTSTGGLAMLLANATNPYLQAPGHMWAVYLPLAVANVMLLTPPTESVYGGGVTGRPASYRLLATAMPA